MEDKYAELYKTKLSAWDDMRDAAHAFVDAANNFSNASVEADKYVFYFGTSS